MHTPGPWRWQDWSTYGDADEGPNKNTLVGPTPPKKPSRPGYTDFNLPPVILSVEGPIENEADKALIAAAPELLKELKHLVSLMEPVEETGLNIPGLATLNGARAAIARAEGR